MAKITLTSGGAGFIAEEGKDVLLKVTKAEYNEEFGRINVTLSNAKGESISNRYQIRRNGKINEGALKAFSYFARQCVGHYVEDIDPEELVGKYILADIVGFESDRTDDDGEPIIYYNIDKVYSTPQTFKTTAVESDDTPW